MKTRRSSVSDRGKSWLAAVLITMALPALVEAQVYGYTDDNGVLILSNVPANDKMRLIADGTPEEAGKTWHYSGQYDDLILKASRLFGVDSSLVRAVIAVESAFNRYALSHKGARGLMQLMPETGRQYGVINAYDPWQNIRGGTAHLKNLIDEFDELHLALAAYNAGATPVRRYRTIPPYRETRDYVRKVLAIYRAGSKIEIVKGGKVYSIGEPGGRTRVTKFHGTTHGGPTGVTGGQPSTLGELARRRALERRGRAEPDPTPPPLTTPAGAQAIDLQADIDRAVYYRFVDTDGIIRITRTRPPSYPYDVLDP